jgi:hypothetical protein
MQTFDAANGLRGRKRPAGGEPCAMQTTDPNPPTPPAPYAPTPVLEGAARYDTPAPELNKGRIFGTLLFVIGLGVTYWLKSVYDSGGSIDERAFVVGPAGTFFGLASVVQPRIFLAGRRDGPPQPPVYRVLAIVIGLLGVGLGLLVRFTLFKEWH